MSRSEKVDEFSAAYAALNSSQQLAVNTIEGPVMVIAGPGTGKTQILTLRIANILRQTDTAPESILALTFTKSGARAMRERLTQFVGALAYRIPIYTFHGFCEHLISEYPEYYERIIGSQPITDIERVRLFERILESPEARLLRPVNAPEYYISALQSIISNMKQENILPDDLADIITEEENGLTDIEQYHTKGAHKGKQRSEYTKQIEKIAKQKTLLYVYRQYEALIESERRYDFDDMIIETVKVLSTVESVRLDVQEQFQYILADEHQDVNGAQNQILSLLASYHEAPNLFVVGDEKQSIYRFQGASLENFLYFENQYPNTKVIALTENYRSAQLILDVAHELVKVDEGPLKDYRVPLTAKGGQTNGELTIRQYAHERYEHEAILKQVQVDLKDGIPSSEIAVIVRSNQEVEAFTRLLRDAGVAVAPSADSDILHHPILRSVLDLLITIAEPANEVSLGAVLQAPYTGLSVADVAEIMHSVRYHHSLTKLLFSNSERQKLAVKELTRLEEFIKMIEQLRSLSVSEAPHRVLASALHESKFLEFVATNDVQEATRIIRRLYDEVEGLVTNGTTNNLTDLVSVLQQRISYNIPLEAPYIPDGSEAVQVMTAHKAKGLEFMVVYVPHLSDANWGGKKKRDSFKVPLLRTAELAVEANEDERRLLYVAMTRAKTKLGLSFSNLSITGREMSASPFIHDVGRLATIEVIAEEVLENDFSVKNSLNLEAVKALLQYSLLQRGLSVTALNNLIANPWNYFFRNVIRLPEVQSPALQFGTAMHNVMEYLTSQHTKTGDLPSFTEARSRLEYTLGRLPLSVTEFTSLFDKGVQCLPAHLEYLADNLPKQTKEELSVRVVIDDKDLPLPALTLVGKIDRIDLAADGLATQVIDYKTGKPKSRNQIEGKTKAADSSYRRQLAFYALLLKLHDDTRYYTTIGTLLFIEPDAKGKIKEETFTSDESVQELLKQEIFETLESLLTGQFIYDDELLEKSDYTYLGQLWRARLL